MSQLISVDEALGIIKENPAPQATETVDLSKALGRTLATPIVAKVTRPPAAVSAMDGYAVKRADVATKNAKLTVIGAAPAGTPFDTNVEAGQAVRIFTGGELPPGTDHVVPQELTARDAGSVTINTAYSKARNVRKAGIDFSQNDILIEQDARIGPAQLAVAAAANHGTLQVYKPLKVAIIANGDELRPAGSALERGQIVNSNPAGLSALIKSWGGKPVDLGIAADTLTAIQSLIARAEDADIIVPVGGASVGDHDHMRTAFAELGYQNLFEKIAVRPGKPTWFATKGRQRVLGLPGNPASAFVCAHLFLQPLINPLYGHQYKHASLVGPLPENGGRTSYLRATASLHSEGTLQVRTASNQDSSLLTPFLTANCLIHRAPLAPKASSGETVKLLLIDAL